MANLDVSYPAILSQFGDYVMKGRKENIAFLAWFLENYYRLDATEVDDAICDEPGDRGVDGIYVSELLQQVDIFQSRMGTATPLKLLGDSEIKELIGTVSQFKDAASVNHLSATTSSTNLKRLIERLEIARLVQEGYEVRAVFITNRPRDQHAIDFLKITPKLLLYDGQELVRQYLPINKPEPIQTSITFDISGVNVLRHPIESGVEMIIAPLLASELVKMSGLSNQELFAWNLRYSLKRTPVNKEIEVSIGNTSEHKYFPAFHNGLTVLTEKLEADTAKNKITMQGYAVVNGCQSLTALYQKSSSITSDLRILTKFVSVSPKSALALKITDHTNRQNGITGRDLQSNNTLQTRIQTEVHSKYPGQAYYRIARGERPDWESTKVIENDEIARILLAFDLREPESCHQNYKLFDEFHSKIFGRQEVTADRIIALSDVNAVVREKLKAVEDRSFGGYALTPFLFLFLLREVLEIPESKGREFCSEPSKYLTANNGRKRLRYVLGSIIGDIINIVDAELKVRKDGGNEFDHKKDLKSPTKIHDIRSKVIPLYQMATNSKFARPFGKAWAESENELLLVP